MLGSGREWGGETRGTEPLLTHAVLAPVSMCLMLRSSKPAAFNSTLNPDSDYQGANLPSLSRAIVACGWFGIQTWIGGSSIFQMLMAVTGGAVAAAPIAWLGISLPELLCFLGFWAAQVGSECGCGRGCGCGAGAAWRRASGRRVWDGWSRRRARLWAGRASVSHPWPHAAPTAFLLHLLVVLLLHLRILRFGLWSAAWSPSVSWRSTAPPS